MAVGIGTVTTAAINNASATTTVSFASTTEPIYVIVPFWRSARTLNTVTFNAVGLTRVAQSSPSNGDDAVEIWRLLAPSATTANVVLTFSSVGQSGSLAIFNTTGQDVGGTPEGTAVTATSSGAGTTTGNLAISGAAVGDLTIVGVTDGGGAAITPGSTGGTGLTEIMDLVSNGQASEAFRVSDAVTAVSATFASNSWSAAAILLKSGGGSGGPVEQPPTLLGPDAGNWTATSGGTFTPPLPTGWAQGTIFWLVTHCSSNTALTDLSGGGWTQIAALTGNNTASQRVETWWKRASASESAPACTLTSNAVTTTRGGRIYGIDGCITTGDPFAETSLSANAASATVGFTDITTTGTNRLVLAIGAYEDDPTTLTTPTNWTQPSGARDGTTVGTDAMQFVEYRALPTASAAGITGITVSGGTFANSVNTGMMIAFMPVPVVAATADPPVRPPILYLLGR